MSEIHLRQPRFTCSACGPFTKNKQEIQKIKESGYSRYIYLSELDKACFQHNMAYGDIKDLRKRWASDRILRHKSFNIAKNPEYDRCLKGLASMIYKYPDKKTAGRAVKNENMSNQKLDEKLHKPTIRKF